MVWLQKTLMGEVSIEGIGLHSGEPVKMTLVPAPINTGLVFMVPGPEGEVAIEAVVENAVEDDALIRSTTLTKHGAKVHTVEHVLAALMGMGITNCEIHLDGPEPPVKGSGSARAYVQMIKDAGIRDQGIPNVFYKINRPVHMRKGDVELTAEPAEHLTLSFHVSYDDPGIGVQDVSFEIRPDVFEREIAAARTFALARDIPALQEMGLAKGGSVENALVFDNGKLMGGQTLRFPDEPARHKLLDLLGDLALLGMPIQGHIKARLSGHAANVGFTRVLAKAERRMPRIYPVRRPEFWDISSIMEVMPHRYPFLLVDRVIELEPGKSVTGIKNVTINEPFFQGHFPGHPIMPAVLIIEAMAQVGGVLLLSSFNDRRGQLVYFSGIDEARFRQPVVPGDQLRFELVMLKRRGPLCKMRGIAYVDGNKVAEAVMMSTVVES